MDTDQRIANGRQYRALVLDDEVKWRDLLQEILQEASFIVKTAATVDEARERLNESFYHLLLLDISLVRNTNRDGLEFFKELRETANLDSMVVIVLSGYLDKARLREALVMDRAVDVLEKQEFDDEEFTPLVLNAMRNNLEINLNLSVIWRPTGSDVDALSNLRVTDTRLKKGSFAYERFHAELDDLIARLFHDAESVVVSPMEGGKSGAGVARVEPIYPNGGGTPLVMKFGAVRDIVTEADNYRQFVQSYVGGARSTAIHAIKHTWLLGGICYTLLGTDEFESFASFYARSSAEEIARMIDHLFLTTCAGWYANKGKVVLRPLGDPYRRTLGWNDERIASGVSVLKTVQGSDLFRFASLTDSRAYRSPIPLLATDAFAYPTYFCTTHGDFNESNILVDQSGNCWLIDFLRTGEGHILRDFVALDTTVRCTLVRAEEATLDERLALETALIAAKNIDSAQNLIGHLDSPNQALQKAFATSLHIRSLAAKVVHGRSMSALPDYFVASAFYGLTLVRFPQIPAVQREHGVLAAVLNAEALR
jgi:CheY-like chemotaxis protein